MRFLLLSIVTVLCCAGVHKTTPLLEPYSKEPQFHVRVLLDEQNVSDVPTWTLSSDAGFILHDGESPHRSQRITNTQITISYYNHTIWIGNRRLRAKQVCIRTPDDTPIGLDEGSYAGYFVIRAHGKTACLVNVVDIEEYVFSVLRWEGWPGWPDEVNKTFAIMCRTYVVDKIWSYKNKRKKRLYDIKNTNIHQTYKGLHAFRKLRDAVDATRGIILTYEGKPIVAMYDACCGGVIPAQMQGVDFRKAPYLARSYPCTFCKSSKLYTWQRQYSSTVFETLLREQMHIPTIRDIAVGNRDDADIVQSVHVYGDHEHTTIPAKTLYSVFKGLRSLCFSVEKKDNTILFHGYGLGHHLGLCQWGTREMVRHGWDYKNILQFFYPSVSFMKLRVTQKE